MALTVVNDGAQEILKRALNVSATGDVVLKLYSNNVTIGETTAVGDVTEATFTGYSAATLTGGAETGGAADTSVAHLFAYTGAGGAQTGGQAETAYQSGLTSSYAYTGSGGATGGGTADTALVPAGVPGVPVATPSGGWLEGAWNLGPRQTLRVQRRRRRRTPVEEQIARLERHIAESRKTTPAVVRLEADTRRRPLPPYVLAAVQRALEEQTARALREAREAVARMEREEEEFAVLLSLALR